MPKPRLSAVVVGLERPSCGLAREAKRLTRSHHTHRAVRKLLTESASLGLQFVTMLGMVHPQRQTQAHGRERRTCCIGKHGPSQSLESSAIITNRLRLFETLGRTFGTPIRAPQIACFADRRGNDRHHGPAACDIVLRQL